MDLLIYLGLISKLNSEYSFLYNTVPINRGKFNENLVLDLLENLFLDEAAPTNLDSLWHITSLLTLSTNPFITSDLCLLVRIRLKSIEVILKYLQSNSGAIKLLTKSASWQDILCQLYCVDKLPKEGLPSQLNEETAAKRLEGAQVGSEPQIVISSCSYLDLDDSNVSGSNQNSTQLDTEKSLLWDNMSSKEIADTNQNTASLEINTFGKLHSTLIKKKRQSLTDSGVNTKISTRKLIHDEEAHNCNMGDISNINIRSERANGHDAAEDECNESMPMLDDNSHELIEAELESMKEEENKKDLPNDVEGNLSVEELFETLIYFTFKLMWEGVAGSNEDAWKVSQLHFLFDFTFNFAITSIFHTL